MIEDRGASVDRADAKYINLGAVHWDRLTHAKATGCSATLDE